MNQKPKELKNSSDRRTGLSREMSLLGLPATDICSMVGAGITVIPFMIQRNFPGIGPYVLSAYLFAMIPAILTALAYAIQSLGGQLEDVVRTRVYVRSMSDWEAIAHVHGVRYHKIQPANSLIQAKLVGEEYPVEMEAKLSFRKSNDFKGVVA